MDKEDVSSEVKKKPVNSFKNLLVWQKGIDLAEKLYSLTEKFPPSEKFGMVSQIRRSAVSVPSNIAEGYRRSSSKEFKQFLNISIGSIGELETQIILAGRLQYLSLQEREGLLEKIDHLLRMTVNLKVKMQR